MSFFDIIDAGATVQDPTDVNVWHTGSIEIPDLLQIGWQGGLIDPNGLYFNGKTYATGVQTNNIAGQRNRVVIVQYDGATPTVPPIYAFVGSGTDGQDTLNHPRPAMLIDPSGYIWIYQTTIHQTPIRVWKSDNPEDISSFTLVHTIPEINGLNYGYPKPILQPDGRVFILVRSNDGVGPADLYNTLILKSTDATQTSWTAQPIADAEHETTGNRHYHNVFRKYGTNTVQMFGTSFRASGTNTYWKHAITKTTLGNYTTYSNAAGTFSKDVDLNGMINDSEMNGNFVVNSASQSTIELARMAGIQVDDTAYTYVLKEGAFGEFMKVSNTGVVTKADVQIPNVLTENQANLCQLWYNGNDIIGAIRRTIGPKTFDTIFRLDKTTLAQTTIEDVPPRIEMPQNYDQIPVGGWYMQHLTLNGVFHWKATQKIY